MKSSLTAFVAVYFASSIVLSGCAAQRATAPIPFSGQTPTVVRLGGASGYRLLYSFNGGSDGYLPVADVIAVNGKLYGTTEQGGRTSRYCVGGCGTVFQVGPDGAHHVIYRFLGLPHDGEHPEAGFILIRGKLYSTTRIGSAARNPGAGTIYEVDTSGKERVIYSFGFMDDGSDPVAGLTDYSGVLYGTSYGVGPAVCYPSNGSCGALFGVTFSGKEKVLYEFKGGNDGEDPKAGLTPVNDRLYGTTQYGGTREGGTVFSITPSGNERIVHTFGARTSQLSDGYFPEAHMTLLKGELYGTTAEGGAYGLGVVFAISPSGKERIVHSFKGSPSDGAVPLSRLVLVNGEFYGTTNAGGAHQCNDGGDGCGTIFKISPSGKESLLYSFAGGRDGEFPVAGLEALNRTLYGTTPYGGSGRCPPQSYGSGTGCGTIFSIAP
jgi:uncharacterized repeat protein (TIGR03803 family)